MQEPQIAGITEAGIEQPKPVLFQGYEIEPSAYRNPGEASKALFLFNAGQDRLVKAGYESNLPLKLQFSIIIPYLEGKLKDELEYLKLIAEDMLIGYGELSNQANKVEVEGMLSKNQTLTFFEGVTRLDHDGYDYLKESLQFSGRTSKFDISDLKLMSFHYFKDIYKKHNNLIEHCTAKIFEQLPEQMQEIAGIFLQEPNKIGPVGRGDDLIGYRFAVVGYGCGSRASRGVRSAREKISQPSLEEVLQLDGEFVPNYAKEEHKKKD